MCILLKLDYAKFGVSNLFFANVIAEKPLGGLLNPLPFVKEGSTQIIRRQLELLTKDGIISWFNTNDAVLYTMQFLAVFRQY